MATILKGCIAEVFLGDKFYIATKVPIQLSLFKKK